MGLTMKKTNCDKASVLLKKLESCIQDNDKACGTAASINTSIAGFNAAYDLIELCVRLRDANGFAIAFQMVKQLYPNDKVIVVSKDIYSNLVNQHNIFLRRVEKLLTDHPAFFIKTFIPAATDRFQYYNNQGR